MFKCEQCASVFKRRDYLVNHVKMHDVNRIRYACNRCVKNFTHKFDLRRHEKNVHGFDSAARPSNSATEASNASNDSLIGCDA